MGHFRTHAPQQNWSLLDHFAGVRQQRARRGREALAVLRLMQ
jgi:hypothetical protein